MPIIAIDDGAIDTSRIDPRGDLSGVDLYLRDQCVADIAAIFEQDKDEFAIADDLRAYVREYLQTNAELYIAVNDKLAATKIISKANLKSYLSLTLEGLRENLPA